MRVAVSGHQQRFGIDWEWAEQAIQQVLNSKVPIERVFTSLAAGSDQLFARVALEMGIPVTAVIPLLGYERFFDDTTLPIFEALLRRCDNVIQLTGSEDDQRSFLFAGHCVADSADLLVAIWDGKLAAGLGGTADIVSYCQKNGKPVVHINPIERTIQTIPH